MSSLAPPTSAQRASGFLLIFLVALIWSLSSFLSKSLVEHKREEDAAVPPFVLTYLATSLFIIYLPFVYLRLWLKQRRLRGR
jgi:drug/metabolite transporter (DMT)-like permease